MRHIDIEEIANSQVVIQFEQLSQKYMVLMKGLTFHERKEFIRTHTDWNMLQLVMYNLSCRKCWYSEAPAGAGDFEVDHFRPKNRSKQHDGNVIKQNGYWWLAYNWRNYRLAGALVNKRRKDRFSDDEEIKGKGDYFPLDLTQGAECQEPPHDNLNVEVPLLLDPFRIYDTTLISFDKDGTPLITAGIPNDDKLRAQISIEFYHLDMEQLNQQRTEIWRLCERELNDINEQVTQPVNAQAKRLILDRACIRLKELTAKNAPFSKVAWACINSFSQKEVFKHWLPNLITSLN